MDHIDDKILTILKHNGKASATEISKVVGLSIPAVAERIRKMEHKGIIEGYGAKISRRKTGYNVTAFIMVNLERSGDVEEFRSNVTTSSAPLTTCSKCWSRHRMTWNTSSCRY